MEHILACCTHYICHSVSKNMFKVSFIFRETSLWVFKSVQYRAIAFCCLLFIKPAAVTGSDSSLLTQMFNAVPMNDGVEKDKITVKCPQIMCRILGDQSYVSREYFFRFFLYLLYIHILHTSIKNSFLMSFNKLLNLHICCVLVFIKDMLMHYSA